MGNKHVCGRRNGGKSIPSVISLNLLVLKDAHKKEAPTELPVQRTCRKKGRKVGVACPYHELVKKINGTAHRGYNACERRFHDNKKGPMTWTWDENRACRVGNLFQGLRCCQQVEVLRDKRNVDKDRAQMIEKFSAWNAEEKQIYEHLTPFEKTHVNKLDEEKAAASRRQLLLRYKDAKLMLSEGYLEFPHTIPKTAIASSSRFDDEGGHTVRETDQDLLRFVTPLFTHQDVTEILESYFSIVTNILEGADEIDDYNSKLPRLFHKIDSGCGNGGVELPPKEVAMIVIFGDAMDLIRNKMTNKMQISDSMDTEETEMLVAKELVDMSGGEKSVMEGPSSKRKFEDFLQQKRCAQLSF